MSTKLKISLILLLPAIFASSLWSQELNRKGSNFKESPKFYADVLDYFSGNTDSTLVSVFIEVPYNRIQFFKNGNKFVSEYNISVSIFDQDQEHLITENNWDEKIIANDFAESTSKLNYNLSLKNFMLVPDKYSVRISLDDKNSGNTYVVNKQIEVRKFSPDLDISDIMIIAKKTNINGDNKLVPNISRNVISKKTGIPIFYEVNSNINGNFRIIYSINASSGSKTYQDTVSMDLEKGKNQVNYVLKDSSLSLGTYKLNVDIINLDTKQEASVSSDFISRWSGVPENVTNLNQAINELVYIASQDELNYIRSAPNTEEKIKRFADFWKKKDPDPNDEDNQAFDEYYNRVAYANDHFSQYMEGWKTDMGMVYIVLGRPDNVERHPFDPNSKPYEIWEYYSLNQSFVFMDYTGFGDYRLMNPADFDYVRSRINN
jgi:GWxTD domain-containing protein